MDEAEARALADEINGYPIFHVDHVQEPIFGVGWAIRFIITYSRSRHWIHSREEFDWVKRNLSDLRGIQAVKAHDEAQARAR